MAEHCIHFGHPGMGDYCCFCGWSFLRKGYSELVARAEGHGKFFPQLANLDIPDELRECKGRE
jgi:hypothetical protein